jgi:hypothetical protein
VIAFLFFAMIELPQTFLDKIKELEIVEPSRVLAVSVAEQKMTLFEEGVIKAEYSISTATKGVGQRENTFQTPLGLHRIKKKIGQGSPIGAIFESRVFKGEIWKPIALPAVSLKEELKASTPPVEGSSKKEPTTPVEGSSKDLITSRILWLEGLEPGYNSGHDAKKILVDSYARYIYIHGTNHESDIGKPSSRGCVRMINEQVIELFDLVREGDLVWIQE